MSMEMALYVKKKEEMYMKSTWWITVIVLCLLVSFNCFAQQKTSSDILKEGLLGAGAGAVGGAASGAKGGELWKGALAGAGVNVVGGALLDSMTGEKVSTVNRVESMPSQDAYTRGYEQGFANGYKQGSTDAYNQGYREGMKEGMRDGLKPR